MMKLKRVTAGEYISRDGRVVIRREVSRQTYRADEICWSLAIDGKMQVIHYDTKRDAAQEAQRYINS